VARYFRRQLVELAGVEPMQIVRLALFSERYYTLHYLQGAQGAVKMLTKSIFLASSSELKKDRGEFEIFIGRKNNDWVNKGVFLKLVIWEDFLDAVSQTRLQDEYNKTIHESDLFVMLFFTKVGKYTEEEFETAFGQFKAKEKPLIFTYFKDAEITTGSANQQDLMSLWAFQEKLRLLGHFQTRYENIDQLKLHFDQQLDKLVASGFFEFKPGSGTMTSSGQSLLLSSRTTSPSDTTTPRAVNYPEPLIGSGTGAKGAGDALGVRSQAPTIVSTSDLKRHLFGPRKNKPLIKLADAPSSHQWVNRISISSDWRFIACGVHDHVRIWNISDGSEHGRLDERKSIVNDIVFSPDGSTLATASHQGLVRLWNVQDCSLIAEFTRHTQWVSCVAFSPNSEYVASGTASVLSKPEMILWHVAGAKALPIDNQHSSWVEDLAFSPDGETLASASFDKSVGLWSVPDGRPLGKLERHNLSLWCIVFSPSGSMLASGEYDTASSPGIYIWNVSEQRLIHAIQAAHQRVVTDLAFHPQGETLASASDDTTLKLWSVETGEPLQTLEGILQE
jgi:WD40 repeat protein